MWPFYCVVFLLCCQGLDLAPTPLTKLQRTAEYPSCTLNPKHQPQLQALELRPVPVQAEARWEYARWDGCSTIETAGPSPSRYKARSPQLLLSPSSPQMIRPPNILVVLAIVSSQGLGYRVWHRKMGKPSLCTRHVLMLIYSSKRFRLSSAAVNGLQQHASGCVRASAPHVCTRCDPLSCMKALSPPACLIALKHLTPGGGQSCTRACIRLGRAPACPWHHCVHHTVQDVKEKCSRA